MKSEVPPLFIGTASFDMVTMTVLGLIVLVGMSMMIGIRKDIAAFALLAGTLTIAMAM